VKTKILLVDDESLILWALKNVLTKEGYEVYPAETGEEALLQIAEKYMDLVITDMEMPGMNGLEVLSHVKKQYPRKKVIMITAEDSEELMDKARERGVDDFIFKPFMNNEVAYRVRKVLEA
jgi:DNA-binding response OmpR family regulator